MIRDTLISIIIPVYNCEEYVRECTLSILSQTHENIEVIAIDDGSTDSSLDILYNISMTDSRLKVFSQENAGVSATRNRGIEQATGEYVLFVDADDYLPHNNAVEKILSHKNDADVVFFGLEAEFKQYRPIADAGVYQAERLQDFFATAIYKEALNSPCTKLYKTKILKRHNLRFNSSIRIGEDLLFNAQYMVHVSSIYYLPAALYFYRTSNENSATRRYISGKYEELTTVNEALYSIFKEKYVSIPLPIASALDYVIIKNVLSCSIDLHAPAAKKSRKEALIEISMYKRENRIKPVVGIGFLALLKSLAYMATPAVIIEIATYAISKRRLT